MQDKIEKILRAEPNLMAKDIAKKLGRKKNEVNPVLYANPNKFVVDSKFRWRLKSKEVTVTFEDRWVNCDSFETSLQGAGSELVDADSIIFILPAGCCFLLEALARLLALCNQLAFAEKTVKVDFSANDSLKSYLNRAGFFEHLNNKVHVLPERPTTSTADIHRGQSETLEELGAVTPYEDEASKNELVKRLTNKFISLVDETYEVTISTIFAELINNVQEHSETKLSGFAGLQKYESSKPHIQTIVSDSGIGVAASLRPSLQAHHKTLYDKYNQVNLKNDIALVKEVMNQGSISRHGAGRGLGFKTGRDRAQKFNAKYSIRQENFSLEFIFEHEELKRIKVRENLAKILGTHICFDFLID